MVRIFHLMLVLFYIYIYIYINSTNIPPIMIINRIYETSKPSVAVVCFLPGWAKDLPSPLYVAKYRASLHRQNTRLGYFRNNIKSHNNKEDNKETSKNPKTAKK